ncbi:YkoF family thiamine/hydroxymethylpyrimidine-binding protein [Halovulum sp. GXIMD14794]
MYTGAQVSLYPMTDSFIDIIVTALGALDPYRDRLRMETDDLSTLMIGPPDALIPAMRDLFVSVASTGTHAVMHATLSRGCPGGPQLPGDDSVATTRAEGDLAERQAQARAAVQDAPEVGQTVSAQFSLYVMGQGGHMDEILGCIEFLKDSGVFTVEKNFCSRLDGDAGRVFATISEALYRFGPPDGHVTLDLTVSANSPSLA